MSEDFRPRESADEPGARESRYSRERQRQGPVPVSTKIFQGLGGLPGGAKDMAVNTFLLLFYNQILGVPATAASVALAIALVVDAISDPMVGAYSDQFRSRLGRRHPFMYAAAIPMGILGYLLFSPPAGASEAFLIGWLLVVTVLLHLSFTFFVVPWNALAAEYSDDYVERTSIISYRYLVGSIGGPIFAFSVWSLVFPASEAFPAGQLNPQAYGTFAVVVGLAMGCFSIITTHLTKRDIPYLLQPNEATQARPGQLLKRVLLSLENRNFRVILVAYLIFAGIAGVGGVFDAFMTTFFWEFAGEDIRWFQPTAIASISGIVAAPLLLRYFQKHRLLMLMLSCSLVLGMMRVGGRFLGLWPDNGDPMLLYVLILNLAAIVFCMTIGGIMFASMIADMVDEQELRTGLRQEGIFGSAIAFSSKAVTSLGLIIGGLLLDFVIAMPSNSAPGQVDGDVLFRLGFIDGIVINAFFVVPIILLGRYTLTLARLNEVQRRLREMRGTHGGTKDAA